MRSEQGHATRLGGRPATTAVIPGRYALSVGIPPLPAPIGWRWTRLIDVAQLETGHTPSRRKPEYWDGDIPWLGIRDATQNHGQVIYDTAQHTNELGIAHSAARLLPTNSVCLSRTASVGYVVVMGRPMTTSQDFVNWICSDALEWRFLKYVMLVETDSLLRFASGTTHQTIYFPEVKAFHLCMPAIEEQRRIVFVLGALDDKIDSNRRLAAQLEQAAAELFRARFVDFVGVEEFEDSEIGRIPRGWWVARIDELACINEQSHTARGHPDRIGYIDISSVSPRIVNEIRHLNFEEAPSRARRILRSGDTIVSTVRPERQALAFIHEAAPGMTASTGFAVVTPRRGAPTFVYRAVTSDSCIARLSAAATGSAYPAVNPAVLAEWRVAVPPDNGASFEQSARPLEGLRHGLSSESDALEAVAKWALLTCPWVG